MGRGWLSVACWVSSHMEPGGPIGPRSVLFFRKYFSSLARICLPGNKKGVKCNKKEENIETMRSAHHKCTSSTWKCGAGSCASGFFAANVHIPNFSINTTLAFQHKFLMKMVLGLKING